MNDETTSTYITVMTKNAVDSKIMVDGTMELSMFNVTDALKESNVNNTKEDLSSTSSNEKDSDYRCHLYRIFIMKGLQQDWLYHKSS